MKIQEPIKAEVTRSPVETKDISEKEVVEKFDNSEPQPEASKLESEQNEAQFVSNDNESTKAVVLKEQEAFSNLLVTTFPESVLILVLLR